MDFGQNTGSLATRDGKLVMSFTRDVGTLPALVISLAGDAGLAHVDELAAFLVRLSASKSRWSVFDLTGLCAVSSLALGQLIAYRNTMRMHGGEVRLVVGNPLVRDVVEKTYLQRVMPVFDTVEAAVSA